jgi:hypothetical protein
MPSVRMAANRAVKVDVDVEGMVALIREAGTGRFIEAMLDFCRKSVGADFVSIFAYSGASTPAAVGYMQHFASDVNFGLCRAAAPVLTSPIKRRPRSLRRNTGTPVMIERGSPTGFRS